MNMKLVYFRFLVFFFTAPHFAFAFQVGGHDYEVHGGQFSFVYPEHWAAKEKAKIYGDDCLALTDSRNEYSKYEMVICRELGKATSVKLREYGFEITRTKTKEKWEVIGAMESVEGLAQIYEGRKIVEAATSCGFSDENGIHSAGTCYKSVVFLDNEYFYVESRGHRSIDEAFQTYRLISRSLVTTNKNKLDHFYRDSAPMELKQPLTQQ